MDQELHRLLATASTKTFRGLLYRCVPQLHYAKEKPPSYLHTSGTTNRCNPEGVKCIYLSEDEATAVEEYRQQWRGTKAEHQPKLTFCAEVRLTRTLDLGNPANANALGFGDTDFFSAWRGRRKTRLQRLGGVLGESGGKNPIAAFRYPSRATRLAGLSGYNWVIYRSAVVSPDFVRILGSGEKPLESWPE